MREIVIISGKGGTGKTSIAASFAVLAEKAVIADCDVDAAEDAQRLAEDGVHVAGPRRVGDDGVGRAAPVSELCLEGERGLVVGGGRQHGGPVGEHATRDRRGDGAGPPGDDGVAALQGSGEPVGEGLHGRP